MMNALRRFAQAIAIFAAMCSQVAFATDERSYAQVGFLSAVEDSELVNMLKDNGATPKAIHMWASGVSLTYRNDDGLSPADFVSKAREETVSFMENAIESHKLRTRRFLDEHSAAEIASDPAVREQARTLLNMRSQFENAMIAAATNHPLGFAVEVLANQDALRNFSRIPEVAKIREISSRSSSHGEKRRINLKPEAYKSEYRDPIVATMSHHDLYEKLVSAAK